MKIISSLTISAALIACSLLSAQAAPKLKSAASTTDARAILENADSLSNEMANAADRLAISAKSRDYTEMQLNALDVLRSDINRIGQDLSMIQTKAETLPPWESRAVDEVLPLMKEIATNTEEAIQNFNANRNHLWATAFPEETAQVYRESERVKEILDGNLKLAAALEEERRLKSALSQ